MPRTPFLPIATPKPAKEPPSGAEWLHEVKFDGYRIQIHKADCEVRLFSKNGSDFTRRYPAIARAAHLLICRSAIIDAELVRCDENDHPDFQALMRGGAGELCAWCFDLLEHDGDDQRTLPLVERKRRLADLLPGRTLRYAAHFEDGEKLLAACAERGLEGIVSKKRRSEYRAGTACGWLKVKTAQWREANRGRWELFEKAR